MEDNGRQWYGITCIFQIKHSKPRLYWAEAVAYATAAPHGVACHWPVQKTMLMTHSPFYVKFHNADCSRISYWMTQHVFKGLKDVGKCQIFVALFEMGLHQREIHTRKSIKCKSCIFPSWLRDRTPRGGISIPFPTQKSKKWVWARYCSKSSPYKYRACVWKF